MFLLVKHVLKKHRISSLESATMLFEEAYLSSPPDRLQPEEVLKMVELVFC